MTSGEVAEGSDPWDADGPRTLWALEQLVSDFVLPVVVYDLATRRGLFGNEAAASLIGTTRPMLQEMLRGDIADLVPPNQAKRISQGLDALVSGAVRSYVGDRTYRDLNGDTVNATHTVMRLDLCDAAPVAVAIATRQPSERLIAKTARPEAVAPVLATLDHEWRVDSVGPVLNGTLGLCPRQLVGERLLEHIHPDDRRALTATLRQNPQTKPRPQLVRLRASAGWSDVEVSAGPLCRHRPHRVGVLLAGASAPAGRSDSSSEQVGLGVPLTAHQREVVERLLLGESIATMAAGMHLSPSTVRNHLSAAYAKAGVHSQAELIAHVTGRLPASAHS